MKQALIRSIKNATNEKSWVMSLNRYLYTLKATGDQDVKIVNRLEFEGTVKFALFQNIKYKIQNMIAISHELDKMVWIYDLDEFLL